MTSQQPGSTSSPKRDGFGCSLSALDDDLTIESSSLTFHRKRSLVTAPGQVVMSARRGYLVGLSLDGGHRRRIFRPHHATTHDFGPKSVYLRNLSEDYKADLSGRFDFILMEISQTALSEIADSADLSSVNALSEIMAEPDPVIGNLALALFPGKGPQRRSSLFVDQIATAIGIHILRTYGSAGSMPAVRRYRLSRGSEARAKEIIRNSLGDDMSMDTLASACNLSRGAFIRAFKETTGRTPYQWLIEQRIEKARDMLLTEMTLAEISIACGFADQSHFTRAFAAATGTTPGAWRRQMVS